LEDTESETNVFIFMFRQVTYRHCG